MPFYSRIENVISGSTGRPFAIEQRQPVSGGCINAAELLIGGQQSYFLKTNQESFLEHFEAERDSLDSLARSLSIRVPEPIASGISNGKAYLILEYIETGTPNAKSWAHLGRQIAALHKSRHPYFGWFRDNVIGSTFQSNRRSENWIDFWGEQRLRPQFEWARKNGFAVNGADALLEILPSFFENHRPFPSLLHGDLWSGNTAFGTHGEAFIFDPCCYFGDRETDIAFTEFFGGFHPDFYAAYNEALPLNSGYARRKTLYNLYHCLNHFNLFGSGYATQAQAMTDKLLSFNHP